ncbi:hypothetical protein MOV64_32080, partial [Agrobacterium sp. BETTINA12B]|nr:hypothetical protein [Agrobacterium sp. BETTINA12B]
MANKKYIESIEDKAFQALDEALQIDFSEDSLESRGGSTPDAPEAIVSEPSNPPATQSQEDTARKAAAARSATAAAAR